LVCKPCGAKKKNSRRNAGEKDSLPFPIEISDWDLTTKTFSLAVDVGMYLSGKRFIDYGQPAIGGFGKVAFNPVRLHMGLREKIKAATD